MIERRKPLPARIGLYSAGLKAYWQQFEGLQDRLLGYNRFIESKLKEMGEVVNFGLVDDEDAGRRAGEFFQEKRADIIFVHSATYYTSSMILPVHRTNPVPAVILNMQPAPAMNYAKTGTGEWLAQCVGCPVPELSNVFERAKIDFRVVSGLLGLEESPRGAAADEKTDTWPQARNAWIEIREWVKAASVKRTLNACRFGYLGGYYSGMLDMYSDFTLLQSKFGLHIELLEMCDLDRNLQKVTDADIGRKKQEIEEFFLISEDSPSDLIARKPTREQLEWACRVAAAQERMVLEYGLDGLSYFYHGTQDNDYERLQSGFIVGHSLLTASGIPCAGEGDIKTNIAMKICDILGVGGSYTEIVAMDYPHNTLIMGHDGPFHILISDGKPVLRGMGLFHGKRGSGVSVEANVISGPVTTLGLSQIRDGCLRLIASQGKAVKLPILMIGNTQTHVDFGVPLDSYMEKWFMQAPTHHCAMSVGHNTGIFKKVAELLGTEFAGV